MSRTTRANRPTEQELRDEIEDPESDKENQPKQSDQKETTNKTNPEK